VRPSFVLSLLAALASTSTAPAAAQAGGDWSGFLAIDARMFPTGPLFSEQSRGDASIAFQAEYRNEWSQGRQSLFATTFLRLDSQDPERTHFDIRELSWQLRSDRWELRAGFRKVFWGVVESYHLVDFINQTDLVESIDGEEKLGQPMVNFAWIDSFGTLEAFLLTGFRERTFPGPRGRFRPPLTIDSDRSMFEAESGKRHLDWAVRWSHSLGPWDIGLAHFAGTSRDPRFLPAAGGSGTPTLVPMYDLVHRTSLDLQLTRGSWLFKLEAVKNQSRNDDYLAAIGGVEYGFVGIFGSRADLSVFAEYLASEEGANLLYPVEDDLFLGARLQLNDVESTSLLAGATVDRKTGAAFLRFEASRRIGGRFRLVVDARAFAGVPETDRLYFLHSDDYVRIGFALHF
jgi:hypothetical protein